MLKLASSVFWFVFSCSCLLLILHGYEHDYGDEEGETGYDADYDEYDYENDTEDDSGYDYEYDPFGCDKKDTCRGANRSYESLLSPSDMSLLEHWNTACFCDGECWKYNDCCEDAAANNDTTTLTQEWHCNLLPGYREYIYVIGSCPLHWEDHHEADLCERFVEDDEYSYLLDIPVFSNSTKMAYANVFCAKCNKADSISPFRFHLLCPFHLPQCSDQLRRAHYSPGFLTWNLEDPWSNETLTITVDYFADWDNLKKAYQARRCWPVVDTCSENGPHMEFCRKHTSYVRTVFPHKSVKFKNIECALCNDANPAIIECVADPRLGYGHTHLSPSVPRQLPTVGLLHSWDIKFHDKSDTVGWQIQCLEDDLLHPIYDFCVPLMCGKHFIKVREQCLRANATDMTMEKVSCPMVAINKEDVTVLKNNSIYVRKLKMTYHKRDFEKNDRYSYLVCYPKKVSSDDFTPTAPSCSSHFVVTVTVHLLAFKIFVYALIPKLQNLVW